MYVCVYACICVCMHVHVCNNNSLKREVMNLRIKGEQRDREGGGNNVNIALIHKILKTKISTK